MSGQFMMSYAITQALRASEALAAPISRRYSLSRHFDDTGFDGPTNSRRTGAPIPIAGAFFVPAVPCYGGCVRGIFGCAGFLESRSVNPRTAATPDRLTAIRGSSSTLGAVPMKHSHATSPSAIQQHAAALKARAFAALRADSSLSVRLRRYNEAMARARALEAQGVRHA